MQKYNFMVLTNAVEGRDDEFNEWYSNTHLDDVLKVPGITAAQRFKLSKHQREARPYPYEYLAIYECETDDVRKIIAELKARSGTAAMPTSGSLDTERLACFFEPITERRHGKP